LFSCDARRFVGVAAPSHGRQRDGAANGDERASAGDRDRRSCCCVGFLAGKSKARAAPRLAGEIGMRL
jgi:hypothetical protein